MILNAVDDDISAHGETACAARLFVDKAKGRE
jgi:hypothetical protein